MYIIHGTMHHLVGGWKLKLVNSWMTISKLVVYLEEWFSYNCVNRFLFFKLSFVREINTYNMLSIISLT